MELYREVTNITSNNTFSRVLAYYVIDPIKVAYIGKYYLINFYFSFLHQLNL